MLVLRIDSHADACLSEDLFVVVDVHEKHSIVDIFDVQLSFELRSPLLRLVRPVTRPLSLTPWVTELDQRNRVATIQNIVERYQGISMACDDATAVNTLSLAECGCHHCELVLVASLDQFLEFVGLHVFVPD